MQETERSSEGKTRTGIEKSEAMLGPPISHRRVVFHGNVLVFNYQEIETNLYCCFRNRVIIGFLQIAFLKGVSQVFAANNRGRVS